MEVTPGRGTSTLYRVTLSAAALVAAVAIVFFLIGIADGSVSAFNITLWIGLLGGVAAILAAGQALHKTGRTKSAIAVLSFLALPGALYGLFVVLVVASGTRWN